MKKIFLLSLQLFILMGGVPCIVDAQLQNMQFKHLTIDNGLPNSWIRCIIQDKYGFIWIGTEDGLTWYDGNTFHVFKTDFHDIYSISNNCITALFEDSRGYLWIGTRQGLNIYDRKNDRFIQYPNLTRADVMSIAEDKDKNLWVGTVVDIYSIDTRNIGNNIYSFDSTWGTTRKGNNRGNAILIDSRNNVWIGSTNGLLLYKKEENTFVTYLHNNRDPNSLIDNNIRSLFEDKDGRLWIGTEKGLDVFANAHVRPQKGIFIHHQNDIHDPKSLTHGSVLSLLEDDKHNLFIGTENGGLDVLDLAAYEKGVKNFIHFKNDPDRGTSLSNNSIYSLFQDKQGNIWIGTYGNGLNVVNPIAGKFIHFKKEPGSRNSLNNNQVNAFCEEHDFLWIGTEGGLNRYNKKDGTFKHYIHDPLNKKSIGSNAVWAICKDKRGNLWIGTWDGGLNRFDYKTETFEHYYFDPRDTSSIGSNNMFSIFEDSRGNLWIGTMGGGLNMFDREKKTFTRYNTVNSGISTDYVQSIMETKSGDLWLANATSFERFDRKTKTFEHFRNDPNDSTSLKFANITSVFEDSKENLWMATYAGLYLFNKSTKGFICYRTKDGLPDNAINGILEDTKGNFWLSTNQGLSEFINAVHHPAKPQFKNYTYEDGLQSNGFVQRSCFKNAKGMLYFGGVNGFNVIDPDKITDNTYIPPVVITDFQVFNKSVPIGDKGYESAIEKTEDLTLSHAQSVFSFDFAALNYISSSKNQYAYKMEGFDKDWNYVGTKRTATYTNLDPGKYVFRVKGSNNDGVWNEKGIALPIVIEPPFWETIWFRLLLVFVAAGIVYWIYKGRMQARDFAAQKRMDAALTKERNLLRAVIDHIPDGIYTKDLNCRKTLTNRADVTNMGCTSETEVLGKDDYELFPKELAEGFIADDRSVLQTGQSVINREEYVIDGEGKKHFLLTTKLPFRDESNQIVGLIGIGRDITERKHAEEERERFIKELQDAAADINVLSGLVPICSSCKKIRDDRGYWTQLEEYILAHSQTKFSHGVCPECTEKLYGELYAKMKKQKEAGSTKSPPADSSKE